MIPYRLWYRLGLAPWERRPLPTTWQRIVDLPPGRALDVGCGTGRDAGPPGPSDAVSADPEERRRGVLELVVD